MTIRLYFDEDSMRHSLVRALRSRGVDVLTALDVGMIERPDEEHLIYASTHGRVLCTSNVADFCRLHGEFIAQGRSHAGIILIAQQRFSVGEQMRRLVRLLATKSSGDMQTQVEFLSAWS
jgi:uncharacterized protein with PIN domain